MINKHFDYSKKNTNDGFSRWQAIETYRLGLRTERQLLTELKISRTLLRAWNRAYQRYRLKRYHLSANRRLPMNATQVDEMAALRRQLADLQQENNQLRLQKEALDTMITLAERDFKIPIRKKSGPKQ